MTAPVDIRNQPQLRTFLDKPLFERINGQWVRCAANPPNIGTGDDFDDFEGRNAPLSGSLTAGKRLKWHEPAPRSIFTLNGNAGPVTPGANVNHFTYVDTGLAAATTHIVKITLGPDPGGSAGYNVGVAAGMSGVAGADTLVEFLLVHAFADAMILSTGTVTTQTALATVFGPAGTPGTTMSLELGTDAGSGAKYVFATKVDGTRLGPFPLPAGAFATNHRQGFFLNMLAGGTPIARWECFAGSTLCDLALSNSSFTGAAGSVVGHLATQQQVWARGGANVERNGSGSIFINNTVAANTPQTAFFSLPVRDVDLTANVSTEGVTTGAQVGPVAYYLDQNNFLCARISGVSALTLAKRVAGVYTTLATGVGVYPAADSVKRPIRLLVQWPNVFVFYNGATTPDITYVLTGTDQTDLGGGTTRLSVGVQMNKANALPSPQVSTFAASCGSSTSVSTYLSRRSLGTDNYSGSGIATGAYRGNVDSDGTKQVVGTPLVVAGDVRWTVQLANVGAGAWARTIVPAIPALDADNHDAMAVAIDGSGRIHACGGMHDDEFLQYGISGTAYNTASWATVKIADLGGGLASQGVIHLTYPQLARLANGNILFTLRNKISSVSTSDQYAFIWNHLTSTWTPLAPGNAISGQIIRGVNGVHNRGVYMGTMDLIVDVDSFAILWLWAKKVTAGTGDEPAPDFDQLYHDYNFLRTDDSGVTWQNRLGATAPSPSVDTANLIVYDTPDGSPVGLDDVFSTWIDASGRFSALVYLASQEPTPWKHVYRTGTGLYNLIDIPGFLWKKRQVCGLTYGARSFFVGVPRGQSRILLYEATVGNARYGQALAVLYDGDIQGGYKPMGAYDRSRLAATGILSLLVTPCDTDGPTGPHAAVQAWIVEFNLAQYIADGH